MPTRTLSLSLLFSLFLSCQARILTLTVANTSLTPTPCSSCPTGSANTVVPVPYPLATTHFQIDPAFASEHTVFTITDKNTAIPEAAWATFCLDQCVAYQPKTTANYTEGPCRSFTVNVGKAIPKERFGGDDSARWFCSGFDAFLAEGGGTYVPIDAPGSYLFGVGVNRICGSGFRAY